MTGSPAGHERLPPWAGPVAALRFLTVLPVPGSPGDAAAWRAALRRAPPWFPLAGAVLAVPLVAAALLPLPALPRAALVLSLWVLLTGGLHEDGWIDVSDASMAPVSRDRRLEILRDPLVGAHGVVGGMLLLLGRFSLLAVVPAAAVALAPILGRWAMALSVALVPPPPEVADGEGRLAGVVRGPGAGRRPGVVVGATLVAAALLLLVATAWPLLGGVAPPLPAGHIATAWAGAAAGLLAGTTFLRARFGGATGDGHGALGLLAEMGAMAPFLLAGSGG